MSAIAWNAVRDGNGITVRHQWNAHTGMWLSAAYLERRHNSAAQRALLDDLEARTGQRGRYGGKALRTTSSTGSSAAPPR